MQANQAAASLASVEKSMAATLMNVAEETAMEWGVKPGEQVEEGTVCAIVQYNCFLVISIDIYV